MLKALIYLPIIGVLAGGGAWYFLSVQQGPQEEPLVVLRKTIRKSAHGTGIIEGNSVVTRIKSPFGGMVDEPDQRRYPDKTMPKDNGTVKANEVVASIGTTEIENKIALEEILLKENQAKRDAIKARKASDQVEQKELELKQLHIEALKAKADYEKLTTPVTAVLHQQQQEDAKLAVERAARAVDLAEKELKFLQSLPTPHELEAANAQLDQAKFHAEAAKRSGTGADVAAVELRFALAQYDKVKRGASAEEKDVASARVARARAELESAEFEKRRIDKPQPPAPPAPADLALFEKILTDARAREAAKRQELDTLKADADSAEVRIADAAVERSQQSLKMLKNMQQGYDIRAPFDGLIVKRLVEPGVLVQPFEDIFWIVDFTRKKVRAEFDTVSLQALSKAGLTASIKSRAFGKDELTARVIELGKVGPRKNMLDDPSQPKGGEVVEVILEIDPPKEPAKKQLYDLLRPGLRVEADIVLESHADVIAVPKSYVASEKGEGGVDRMYVMKIDAGNKKTKYDSAHKQEVKCNLRDEYYVEITEGLNVDDQVIKPKSQGK